MSDPPSDPPTLPDPETPDRGLDQPPSHAPRPAGESGGHAVQDWEQPPRGRRATLSDPVLDDEPMPPTTPLYLRPPAKATAAAEAEPAFDARTQTLTAQTGALADALTRGFAGAIAEAMRPIVAATIVQLLPMLLSLGNVPDEDADPVRAP